MAGETRGTDFTVFYCNKGRWHMSPMRGTYEFVTEAVEPYFAQLGHETRVALPLQIDPNIDPNVDSNAENDKIMAAFDLNDDELVTLLETLEGHRETLLAKRTPLDLPPVVLYENDELPPADTLDGQILRVGALHYRLQLEYVKREMSKPGMGELPRVAALVRADLDAKPDALPVAFDGDPKL